MIDQLQDGTKEAVQVMVSGHTKAEQSVEFAEKAHHSLETIAKAVSTISDMNTQIATSAEEQSSVAEEINMKVTSISQISSETHEGAKQTASASAALKELAQHQQKLLQQFKV